MKKHLLLALLLFAFGARSFAQVPLTVADGSETNEFVPIYGWYADAYLRCQVVYPAADLAGMAGGTINSLTFYLSSTASGSWGSANFHVRLGSASESTISAFYPSSSLTEVYAGSLDGTQSTMTITFTTPYVYTGGDLLLEVTNEVIGSYKRAYFYGISALNASVQGYNYSSLSGVTASQSDFIPKTTFNYTPGGDGPMCFDPTGLTVSGETTDGATVSWTAPAAGNAPQGYQVCCLPSTATFDASTATWTSVTGTTHTFTGLSAGTQYTVHVRSVCGSDFYSDGNASANITTALCNPTDRCEYTFVLGDGYGDGWNGASFIIKQNGITMATLAANNHNVYNTQTYDTMRVMLCGNASISLEWSSGSYDGEASFTMMDPNGFQLYECTDGSTLTDGATFYTGTTSCTPITCFPPTDLHASVTTDEATIGWTDVSGNHLGYQAEWDGSVLPGLSGNPFSFTGLSPASTHTVRVRTVCAAGDTSNWSTPHTFTTDCDAITAFPYYEGFDNSTSIPACWKAIDGDGDGNNWFITQDSDGEVIEGGESTSGNHYITSLSYDYNTDVALTPNNWLLSPSFTLPSPCNLSLVWYAKSQDPSYLEPLDILISTTGGDTADFTSTVMSLNAVPGEYTQYVYSLANYAGQTVQFAFVHRNVTDMFRVNIDDVSILEIPQVVTNDATALATATATLNGSVTGQGMTAYGFEWKATSDSEYERDTVSTGDHTGSISFNLANLDPNTSYTFRTFAAVGIYIYYGDEKTFTTEQLPCPAPANLTVADINTESARLTWASQLPTTGSYNVYLNNTLLTQTPVSELTYLLTGLTPGTSYEVTVAMVCNGTEGPSDTKTFNTPCLGQRDKTIGTGSITNSNLPFYGLYNYAYSQQIYDAAELNIPAGSITAISFYCSTLPSNNDRTGNIRIWLANTTKSTFDNNTDYIDPTTLTEVAVISGVHSFVSGWNTFTLDQPFTYDGTSNLVVAYYEGYDGYSSMSFWAHSTTDNKSISHYNDTYSSVSYSTPATAAGTKYFNKFRSDVRFDYCDPSITCVPPTVSVDNVTAHDAEVSWTPGYQESAWGMQYKGENDNDWTTVTLTPNSPNPYTLSNLTSNTAYALRMWSICGDSELSDTAETTFTTLVTCPAPTTLAASNETPFGVTLTWTSVGTPGSFEVEYSDGENTLSTVVNAVSTTTQQTTTLTGLSANTAYTARVRAICGVNDLSTWSNTASFTTLISCPSPTVPVVLDKTANSATISWTPGGTEGEWDVYYSWASPTDPTLQEGSTTYTITATSYTFTGLNANTTYSAHVRAVCGNGDVSDYVDVQFTTPCGSVSVPYTENFDSYTQGTSTSTTTPTGYPAVDMPACWTFLNNATTTSTYPIAFLSSSSNYAVSGNCLFFKSSSITPLYAVLPMMSENLNELQLTFTYRNESVSTSNGTLHVGYMTNLADVSTYVEMYSCPQTTTKTEVEVNFNTVTVTSGTPYYIVFKYEGGSSNAYYLGIDNVSVDYIPACPAPTSLAASNETATTATLTWTSVGTPSSFEVEYNDGENTFSTVVNANPTTTQQTTTLTGLSSITDYLVRVRAICGVGDTSAWSNMASFTTACAVFTAPYTEDFTGFNTLVSACWKRYSGLASSTTTSISDLSPLNGGWNFNNQNVFGQGHAKLNIYGTTVNNWLMTPAIDISTLTNPELTFDLALTAFNSTNPVSSSTTQADDRFIVFVSTDNGATWSMSNATVWDNVGGDYVYNNISATGERISIPLSQYAGQTIKIAFYGESTVGNNGDNDVHIDNVSVDERPSCPAPAGVTVSNVTATTATLTWTPGGNENAWDIYVPSSSVDVPVVNSDNMHSVTATPYTVSNLPSNSICTLYVRANCGNEESDWVSKTFTTPCGTVNIPYTEDFDSYSSSEYPTCWSRYPNTYSSSTNYPIINLNSAHSGSNSLYMYSYTSSYYMAILPELNLDGMSMSDLWVTFYYSFNGSSNSSNGKMIVGVMTNPADPTSFYPVDTVQHTAPTTWEFKKVHLTNYTGNGRYIAFRNLTTAAYAGFFIDDVTVEPIPSCLEPGNLFVSEVTATSTTLTWTAGGTETEWDLYVADVTVNPTDIPTANSNPTATVQNNPTHTLTGLTTAHTYKAYIRANCGNDGMSEWSTPLTFVPGSYNMGSTRTLTTCQAVIYDNGGMDGNYGNDRNDTLTIYPEIPGNLVQVSGTISVEGSSWDFLDIYDGAGTTNLLLHDNSSTRPHTIQTTTSTTGPLTLYFESDDGVNYPGFELNVTCVPPCEAPATVQASAVSHGQSVLTFGYDQQAQNINLELQYKATNATSWSSSILVQDNNYTLAGLDNNTTYDVRVRSACGNADAQYYSEWVTGMIDIACPAPVIPDASYYDYDATTIMLSWDYTGSPIFQVMRVEGNNSTIIDMQNEDDPENYFADDLTPSTEYTFYVRSICNNGLDTSDWSAPITITTPASCPVPTGLSASNETADGVTLTWTAGGTENVWELYVTDDATDVPTVNSNPTATTQVASHTMTGLSSNTAYTAYVRAVCDNNHSEWSTAATFKTTQVLATLPYTQDWESATENANWTLLNGTQTNQWTVGSATSNGGTQSLYVSNDDGSSNAYTNNSTSTVWAYRDIQFGAANAFQLSFDWKCNGEGTSTPWDYLGVYIGTPGDVTVGSVTPPTGVDLIGKYNLQSDWQNVSVQLDGSQYSNTTKRLYLLWRNDFSDGSQPPAAVDNITITPVNCTPPTALTVEDVTTTEIMFSVNGTNNVQGYQVEYGATGFAQGQGTTIFEGAASTPPTIIVIDGLTASTTYDFYVRTICSEGDTSAWSPVTTENTLCDVVSSFPWSENFDAVSINTLPVCWTNTNDVGKTDWIVSSSLRGSISAHSASNVVQFYCQSSANRHDESSLQMPTFDLTALNNPMLGFWYTNKEWGGDQDEMTVYYRTSPTDTWTLLASYTDNVAAWTYDSLALPNPSATYQIKFVGITDYGYGINLDDIVIKEMPITVCSAPTDVTVSDITSNTAEVSWTDNANVAYELQYRTAGTAPQTVDTNITTTALAAANNLINDNNIGSGTIDANISYTGIQNGGSNAPKYYTSGQNIRLYSNTSGNGNGGSIKLTPSNGAVITGLDITTSGSSYTPSVSYSVDGGTSAEATLSGLVYTISGISAATSLEFQNTNTNSSNTQLRVTQMTVHYTLPGTSDAWTTIVPATSPTVLSNLDPETGYEVQVRTICAVGDTSDWSSVVPFSTEEFICGAPVKLSVNDITMNSAEVIWSDDGTYPTELQYMANGTPDQYVDNTFDFSQQGYTNEQSLDGVIVNLDNNISFVANKLTASYAPAYYNVGTALRIYGKNNFIVSAANGVVITGIEIDAGSSNHPNINYVVDNGQSHSINGNSMHYEISNINANTVTVTNPNSSGHLRLETLTVHYTIPGTAGTWTSMANVTSPVQLTGLMPNTNYSVRLRNICSASDTSVWTSTDFTTLTCPPITKSITAEACGIYTWDGTPYTTSGDYTKTYTLATGCDSVVTLHLTIHNPVHASVTEEACDSYTWNNTEYTQSGTYTYPHQDANGCTQVDTLHLTVFHPTHVAYTESACGTYTWNNTEYTQSGTYTYPHQDANGCTQVDTLHLTIHNPTHVAYTESACGSYTWNNTVYTQSGTYTYSHQDANGCTQVDTLHLTINPIPVVTVTGDAVIALYESATLTASGASTYVWNTGETAQTITVTPSSIGSHSYIVVGTSEFSCQSAPDTFVVEVGACRPGTSTETVTACDSFVWHGTTYTQSTGNAIYRIPNGSANGCDSVVTLHLTILNSVHNEITDANCVSYEWNGQTYTSSGDYTRTFQAANGCDSIVTLHLTIKQPVTKTVNIVDCDSYMWDNQTYTTSGDYTRTFTAANGCDSIVTLHLTIKNHVTQEITASNCGSYTWNNEVYEASGDYEQIFTAANGCDSVVTLHLTINPEYDLALEQSICKAALPYSWRDTLFDVGTETGTYVFHRQTAAGCDSTVTLHLVVNDAIATEVTETGCDSYTWNNQVYTTSGDYVQTLQTSAGCDSTVTMHLTIYSPVHEAITVVNCGPYQWNNAEYAQSGTYTYSHEDAHGCTQVDTLHLTVKPVPVVTITPASGMPIIAYGESETLTASGADSYVWNTQETTPSITVAPRITSTYSVVGTTDGCESESVSITVNVGNCTLITSEFTATGCGRYTWNGTVYEQSGDYQQLLVNDLGCDSLVTLHLTIYPNSGVAQTVNACGSYLWYHQNLTESGTYTFAYYDGNGCIQEDTLYLTIHHPVNESLNIVSCGPYMGNNTEYTQDGTYTYTHEDAHGCTQVDTLRLTIKPVPVVTVSSNNTQIVQHESTTLTASGATSYVWSNQATGATVTVTPMQTTTYSVVGTVDGCASEPATITVEVTPCTPAEGVFTVTACNRYVWYGTTYTESTNTATHAIQRPGMCDSIVTLHLTILHPVAEIINITACERYTWHNTTFTQSGRYTYSHQDANGCTQVDTLYLTILRPTHTAVTVSECNAFVWHNIEYTQSGTYTFAFADVNGCTQVDTLHLTIFHPAHTAYNVDACGSYVWNNTEYTQSGTYTYRHRDANGCQQIDTLHLTIHHPVAQSYEAVACESYTWNNTVYTQSGTYTYAHEDAHGCMQVDTLRLTIHNAVAESFEAEACGSYTWNNTVYTQSGIYTYAHADANGCTQVDTLHLTIYNAVAEVYETEACESYTWNNTEYTQSGTYTYTHEDIHGCTQVDTLHLIINNPTHTAVTESACGSYTWNNTEYTQSGIYTYAHADANGCTQVDTLHLTIFQPATTEFSDNACGSYYWNNVYYNESGDYVQHFQTVDGCDSTVTLHLTIYPRAEVVSIVGDTLIHEYESATLTATALNGNPFWVGFGQTSSITVAPMTTTTYTVMAVSEHCASAPVRVTVTVLPCIPVQGVETVTACESYEWHGVTYTESTNTPTFTIERQGVCDSVVTLHLTIFNPTHVAYTESACGSYVWNNTEYTQSGTYTYTHTDANGCTQVDTLHLTINNPVAATYEAEACGSYTWNNTEYTQSGTYTFAHADANGCTQVDTLHLTIHNPTHVAYTESACGSYVWNNTEYTQSGTYTYTHTDANGCTQVDTLHLTINNPTHVAYTESACGSYVWNNTEYTQSGTYTFAHTDANGCTQVDTLHLTILNAVHEAFTVSECNAYTWHGTTYTQSGTYTFIHSDANGCTKVDTLHLTVFHPQPNVYTLTTCGDYVWHGTVYTQTGVYTYTTTDINGCTQVDTLHLFVNHPQNTASTAEACGSYVWHGNTYTQSGVYVKAVQNNYGCMHLDTLYLTIHHPLTQIVEATACESYTWNNVTYTQSGHYVQHFQTMFGCDSTVTLNLTVNHPQHQSVTAGECGSYTWHGTTYTASGVYTYAHSDANGCTQVDTLHLIIYQPRHQSLHITECESFTWGGTTYTQSGVYTYAHPDNHGCTQVDTLYLTINHPTGTSITVTECEMYDWNGFIYTQSGTYTQSHLDANGCTQVDTLRLTIYHPVHQSVTVTECFEYTWHGTTYNFSGVYTYTHLDNHGCTQVDTLHLTIHHPQSSTITVDACGSYQWYGTNYTQSGVYTHTVTGTYGCQVKDTLILHIHQPVSTQFSARACSYYVWDGTVYTQSGDYVKHYYTQWGCDSTVTLHLDIHQPQSSEFTIVTENSCYTWNGVEYCQNGTYMQQFEDSYGCDSVVTLHLTLRVGVEDYDGYAVSLYPNPTTGVAYVEVSGDEMERVEVYDSYGKLLQTRNVSGNVAQIELSAYAKGVYHVRVTTTKGVVTKRVVKN